MMLSWEKVSHFAFYQKHSFLVNMTNTLNPGQGLILLLSGPPGTGKTLTAEAVADKTRRPLYYLQAEDLGTNAAHLGPKIKKVFEMATEWDAVILLDGMPLFQIPFFFCFILTNSQKLMYSWPSETQVTSLVMNSFPVSSPLLSLFHSYHFPPSSHRTPIKVKAPHS